MGQDEEGGVSKRPSIWMHLPLLFPKVMVDDLCGKAHPQINVSSFQLVVVKSHFPLAMLFQTEFLV